MKLRVQDQVEDQRRPGKRLYVRTVKHVSSGVLLKMEVGIRKAAWQRA